MAFEYELLTPTEQLTQIQAKLHELEQRHLQLELMAVSSEPGVPAAQNTEWLTALETSIASLRERAAALTPK